MGLTAEIARFILEAAGSGPDWQDILTLGRQHMGVSPELLRKLLADFKRWPPRCSEAEFEACMRDPMDRFLGMAKALGAARVAACDASSYEGASLRHDLNQPIPEELAEQFDLVLDSGTLEHVFNFPVAIGNCMRLLRPGGTLLIFTPANNYMGHGFYQFSPELFYRVLSVENGFQLERMHIRGNSAAISSLFGVQYPFPLTTREYAVKDPAQVKERVGALTDVPVLLFIHARKARSCIPFERWPQQSDYVTQWAKAIDESQRTRHRAEGLASWLRTVLSERVCREVLPKLACLLDPFRMIRYRRENSLRNRKHFEPLSF